MKLQEICELLQADVLVDYDSDAEAFTACGSDLISDILRFIKVETVLLTGLTTLQMIKAAQLLDVKAIIFVRGKRPAKEVEEIAKKNDLPVLCTKLPLFEACGCLSRHGLKGCSEYAVQEDEHVAE